MIIPLLGFALFSGCIGYNPPHLAQMRPFTLIDGGDQLGRDQLANRAMVADLKVPIKGKGPNEVLTFLGQPQEIQVRERKVSEDWYFVYYKRYKTWPNTKEGSFLVRFYKDEVVDVVKVS